LVFPQCGFLGLFGGQDYWHKVYAMKDETVAKRAFIINGILIFLPAVILTYIGLIARSRFPAVDPDLAILFSEQLACSFKYTIFGW